MDIRERKISREELDRIYEDFGAIEAAKGIPAKEPERFELTAEENGRLIGYASGITEHRWFYLTDLWVAEDFRRRGLGTRLLKKIESKAAEVGMIHIYLWTAGAENMRFYEKNGYRRFALFEDKYEVEGYCQAGYEKSLT